MTMFHTFRCSSKHMARKTVLASTFGVFLPFVSPFSPVKSFASTVLVSSKTRTFSTSNNYEEQAMTKDAMQIIKDAIQAVDPYEVVRTNLVRKHDTLNFVKEDLRFDLSADIDGIILVGFGKAASAMSTSVLEQIFPSSLTNSNIDVSCKGVVVCKDGHVTQYEREVLTQHDIEIHEASHPVPDARSIAAADRLIQTVSSHASDRTLVICCISGGGSSLFCRPSQPLTLDDLQQVNSILLASGMGIQDMNILRKRLEDGKGGRLAASCFPSHVVALTLSDVVGDPLDLIASGPTVPDKSTWENGWDIVQQYNLEQSLPRPVVEMLKKGVDGKLKDSPTSDHPSFEKSKNILVGNNALAVQAAAETAKMLGYQPVVLGTEIEGEAATVAKIYTAMSSYLQKSLSIKTNPGKQQGSNFYTVAQSLPVALIAGGESTVSLTSNSGKGGRNQELALAAALELDSLNLRNVVLASVGTDGGDGPTDAAGAVVDATTTRNTQKRALEALVTHNAYPYLDSLEDSSRDSDDISPPLIKTGPTGTNVADICITLIKDKNANK